MHNREGLPRADGESRRSEPDQHPAYEAGLPAADPLQDCGEHQLQRAGLQGVPPSAQCRDCGEGARERTVKAAAEYLLCLVSVCIR